MKKSKLQINLKKKHVYFLTAIIIIIAGLGYAIAYGGTSPATVGHSAGEIDLTPLYIDTVNGKVGIGTTSPVTKLAIVGSNTTGWPIALYLKNTDSSPSQAWRLAVGGSIGDGSLPANGFVIHQDSVATRIAITSGGNVGIGVTDPLSKLVLPDTSSLAWKNAGSSGGEFTGISSISSVLNLNTNGLTRMVIDTSGNVGIGTASPAVKLHIAGNLRLDDGNNDNIISGGIGGVGSINFRDNSVGGMTFSTTERYQWQINSATKMVIDSNGNVAINNLAAGSGNAYVCVNANGQLYRGATACS